MQVKHASHQSRQAYSFLNKQALSLYSTREASGVLNKKNSKGRRLNKKHSKRRRLDPGLGTHQSLDTTLTVGPCGLPLATVQMLHLTDRDILVTADVRHRAIGNESESNQSIESSK